MSVAAPESADTTICPTCKKKKHTCRVCNHQLECGVKFCSDCQSYQDWRRIFAGPRSLLAVAGSLVIVITALIALVFWLLYHQSHISPALISASTEKISLRVEN